MLATVMANDMTRNIPGATIHRSGATIATATDSEEPTGKVGDGSVGGGHATRD